MDVKSAEKSWSARLSDGVWRIALRAAYRVLLAWWWIARPERRGVHVAVWWGERLLVIQNSYRRAWTLPSGGVKSREDLLSAAVRELREEVGIATEPATLRLAREFTSREEYKTDRSAVYELSLDEEPRVVPDGREVVAAEFVGVQEATARSLTSIVSQYLEWRTERAASCG